MGNCSCVCRQTDEDEATDALLNGFEGHHRPRGPPPPYQVEAPLYAMSEEQRIQLVQRITMIQCLPLGKYDVGEEEKKKNLLEESEEVQGSEKKGEVNRECPICMMDFAVGEPIRLLPCMHFYHMRCIDNWLMRSYSCPTCMERVDVGMRNTAVTASSQPSLRRRRRGERGSSSSMASGVSMASGHGGKQYPKGYEDSSQFVAGVGAVSSGQPRRVSGQGLDQLPELSGQQGRRRMEYLTDQQISSPREITGQIYSNQSATGCTVVQVEGASAGASGDSGYGRRVEMINGSEFAIHQVPEDDELAYSMNQMTFNDFQDSIHQGAKYSSPPSSPFAVPMSPQVDVVSTTQTPPYSPPVFECHFEYPTFTDQASNN